MVSNAVGLTSVVGKVVYINGNFLVIEEVRVKTPNSILPDDSRGDCIAIDTA